MNYWCGKWHFLVRNRIRIWRTVLHTPTKNSPEYHPPIENYKTRGRNSGLKRLSTVSTGSSLSPSSPRDFLTLSPNLPIRQKLLSYTKRRLAWADKMHMSSTSFCLKFTLTFCLIAYRASALSSFQSFTDFSEYLTTIVAKNELSPVHSFCNYYSCRHSRR